MDDAITEWALAEGTQPPAHRAGAAVIGVLLGLEMMRRVDASAIDDQTAVAALRGAVGAPQLLKEPAA